MNCNNLVLKLFFLLVLITIVVGCEKPVDVSQVYLSQVSPFFAVVQCETDEPAILEVEYGEGELFDRTVFDEQPTKVHTLRLTGLKPSTLYGYRFKGKNEKRYFRSAPTKEGAFDMVLVTPIDGKCPYLNVSEDNLPDLVIGTKQCEQELQKYQDKILTKTISRDKQDQFSFGGWEIVLAHEFSKNLLVDTKSNRMIIFPRMTAIDVEIPANILLISSSKASSREKEFSWDPKIGARFEVDAYEVAWVAGSGRDRQRKIIVEAPEATKKTCLYCDRLMESGRYEESISWYRNFIKTNQDRHAVEDAYYSIARILDEKLFRYEQAITAYQDFLTAYPTSRQKSLALYRIKYLEAHKDSEFAPLAAFEKAKAKMVRKDPMPTVTNVEQLLLKYPKSSIAPEAQFWLGHLLEADYPKRAQQHYKTLANDFPKNENAPMALIALGDIHYREKEYFNAVDAYEHALSNVPENYLISVKDKLRKSKRNIKREAARWGSVVVLIFWLLLTVYKKAIPSLSNLRAGIILLAVYAIVVGIYFSLTYERSKIILPLIGSMALVMSIVLIWNRALDRGNLSKGLVFLHMASTTLAGLYLLIYHFHQLYVFGI